MAETQISVIVGGLCCSRIDTIVVFVLCLKEDSQLRQQSLPGRKMVFLPISRIINLLTNLMCHFAQV